MLKTTTGKDWTKVREAVIENYATYWEQENGRKRNSWLSFLLNAGV
jgi:hypothetical protein